MHPNLQYLTAVDALADLRESKIPGVQMGPCKIWLCIV